jgi:hypothetical protein
LKNIAFILYKKIGAGAEATATAGAGAEAAKWYSAVKKNFC